MATRDRREQERAHRKQHILAAARSVFAQRGVRRATVDEIAQHAEVAKGTIYLYFENKDAILAELVLCALAELLAQLQSAGSGLSLLHPAQRLTALADAYLTFAQRSPDYFRLLTAFDGGEFARGISPARHRRIIAQSDSTLDLVAQTISDGVALGIFTPGDSREKATVLWAALNGSLALMSHPIRRELVATDVARLYRATLQVYLNGLTNRDLDKRSIP